MLNNDFNMFLNFEVYHNILENGLKRYFGKNFKAFSIKSKKYLEKNPVNFGPTLKIEIIKIAIQTYHFIFRLLLDNDYLYM
jgi:hypothetical protein